MYCAVTQAIIHLSKASTPPVLGKNRLTGATYRSFQVQGTVVCTTYMTMIVTQQNASNFEAASRLCVIYWSCCCGFIQCIGRKQL